jgi:hypothetical protein
MEYINFSAQIVTKNACDKQVDTFTRNIYEYYLDFWKRNNGSHFAKHLIENNHSMDCIENITNVVNLIKKGGHKNTFEKYYIYNGTKNDNQINDKNRFLIKYYWCYNIGQRQLKMLI